jgi:hypothetical protein
LPYAININQQKQREQAMPIPSQVSYVSQTVIIGFLSEAIRVTELLHLVSTGADLLKCHEL